VTSTTRRARGLPALDRLRTCSGVSDRPRRGAGVPCCALTSSHLGLRSVAPPAERRGSTGWSGSRGSSLRTQDPVPPPTRQGCRQLGLIAACQMWTPGVHLLPVLGRFRPFRRENPEVFHQDQRVQVPLLALRNASRLGSLPSIVPFLEWRGTMLSPSARENSVGASGANRASSGTLTSARRPR
jgi:hypothetical protein